jgi:hypothetical protein
MNHAPEPLLSPVSRLEDIANGQTRGRGIFAYFKLTVSKNYKNLNTLFKKTSLFFRSF